MSAIVCTYAMRRVDPDLYGYLAYGRLFLARGGLTFQDPFAYTSQGLPWVTFEYLAQVLLWIAYRSAGPLGLIVLKCLVGGTAMYFLYAAMRVTTDDPFVWLPVFLLCGSTLSRFFLFRPQIFTFACFALFVTILFRFLIQRRAPLWILPIVTLVWANTHGGFLAGLGAIGLAVCLRVAENLRNRDYRLRAILQGTHSLWLVLVACLLATFVNPRGVRLWSYVLTELLHDSNRRHIAEWRPLISGGDVWSFIALTVIAMALVTIGLVAQVRLRPASGPAPVHWVLSAVPLIVMSYVSARHVPLAVIWSAPVIALLGSRMRDRKETRAACRRIWFVLNTAGLSAFVATVAVVSMNPYPVIEATGNFLGSKHPCRAIAFLRENRLSGNVYNPLHWGSYITWELYPAVRVAMDGRNISLFSDRQVLENFEFYDSDGKSELDVPFQYPSDFLLVPSDMAVLPWVLQDKRWRKAFSDNDAVLFVRADAAHQALLDSIDSGHLKLPAQPCPAVLR